MAEPELRYGLKQIKQNKWYQLYKPDVPIDPGNINAPDTIHVHKKLLKEMKQANESIDINYTRFCIEGNLRNALTAHYNLLIKKKTLM